MKAGLLLQCVLLFSCNRLHVSAQPEVCSILSFFDFSGNGEDAFGLMAAAQLATDHFNTRDPTVVAELASGLLADCTITLPDAWFRDSQSDAMVSLSAYQEISVDQQEEICAVIGLQEERTLQVLSGVAQLDQIPVVVNAPRTIRNDFESVVCARFPLRYVARGVADYMKFLTPPREFMVTLYDSEDFDGPFQERAEDEHDYAVSGEWIVSVGEEDSIEDAIEEILEEGYTTVLIDTKDPKLLTDVAELAYEGGLFDRPILWVIGSKAIPPHVLETMEFEVDSPTDLLLRGAMVHADYDPFLLNGDGDKFAESWKKQDASLVGKLQELHPLQADDPSYFGGDADYFQTMDPPTYASFIYDSVILTGISACRLQEKQKRNDTDLISNIEGGAHLGEMLMSEFDGASGNFAYAKEESEEEESDEEERKLDEGDEGEEDNDEEGDIRNKNRSPDGFQLGIYNIRSEPVGDGKNRYYTVLTAVFEDSEWRELEDEKFIYHDGTTNPPVPTRETFDYHYLSRNYFIAGMVMMSIALVVILGSLTWVVWTRKKRIVRASQPEFLYLLCFGSVMVAASLAFVSFDESSGYSEQTLSAFCMTFPWLFVLGYVIQYCALAGKLWRINKLMSHPLRRKRVRVVQALWPFAILIGCIVTLSCWQAIDPYVWERIEYAEEPLETLGKCSSENLVPYVSTLGALIGTATLLALYASWRAKHVQKELSESKWIFAGIFSHVQMWAIGIPVYMILDASTSYIIAITLTFLFSTTMVIVVVWPKIYTLHFYQEPATSNLVVNVSKNSNSVRVSGISGHNTPRRVRTPSWAKTDTDSSNALKSSNMSSDSLTALKNSNKSSNMSGSNRSSSKEMEAIEEEDPSRRETMIWTNQETQGALGDSDVESSNESLSVSREETGTNEVLA